MKQELRLPIIVTIIYAIFTMISVLHHEAWVDEAQFWLLCKNLSFFELFPQLHNEGHTIFHYLLVIPFAKFTSNIIFMQLITWVFMVASIFLLFRYSPFHIITKFAITLSAGYIYFFPVIAREYSLVPLLIFLAAILYSKQKQHPILYCIVLSILLCTHVVVFLFATLLMLMFIWDNLKNDNKKSYILCVFICLLSLVYVIWQLHDTPSSNYFYGPRYGKIIQNTIFIFSSYFKNIYNYAICSFNDNKFFVPIVDITFISILVIIFIGWFISLFINSKKIFLFTTMAVGFQLIIYILHDPQNLYPVKIFDSLTMILFAFWIILDNQNLSKNNNKIINILLSAFFLITSYNGFNYWILDFKNDYSGAKKLSEYIQENISDDSIFLYSIEQYIPPIKYYLYNTNYEFISAVHRRNYKYSKWNEESFKIYSNEDWLNTCLEFSENYPQKEIYIFIPHFLIERGIILDDDYFEEIFVNEPVVKEDEVYHLYRYKK